MNVARSLLKSRHFNVGKSLYRNFRVSITNYESSEATQPRVREEKYDFEDLNVFEREERRKAAINPFMKDVFVSIFNKELLAYPEILNKTEYEALNKRSSKLQSIFADKTQTQEDRKNALKAAKIYAAPVSLTNNGLAINYTECIRYLEAISSDLPLAKEVSDHWVALEALRHGLGPDQYRQLLPDLVSGERLIALCVKETLAERSSQADFRTKAELDSQEVWRITGEKLCYQPDGYLLVLCATETGRLSAFLVHPNADGVSYSNEKISFARTPGIPLDAINNEKLAKILGGSRLHTATLMRSVVQRAIAECVEFVRSKVFNGKALSELSTIRAQVGDALVDVYASESSEYFSAGLADGYMNPDAEVEMAMCRNFMTMHGMKHVLKLTNIASLEEENRGKELIEDMRTLTLRGETLDSLNMFIALNGIHHAGKAMAEEIKQMRNPVFHPGFIIKKMIANRHQENDDPKLNLFLAEHLHPSLRQSAEHLEYCVIRMRYACETLMARHGKAIGNAYTELVRLSEAGTEILAMTSALARASRSYCIGVRNSEVEMKLAGCFVEKEMSRVKNLILEIDDGEFMNLDHFRINFGQKVLDTNTLIVEKPTTRVFW